MFKNLFNKIKTWCSDKFTEVKEKFVNFWTNCKENTNGARKKLFRTILSLIVFGVCVFTTNIAFEITFFLLFTFFAIKGMIE